MIKRRLILCGLLSVTLAAHGQGLNPHLLAEYYSQASQKRQTYADYARDRADLLKLSDSRDPARINAEFQSKLAEITRAHQDIYQSKVAAFAAGVNTVQSSLSGPYQQLGGAVGGALSDIYANSARRSAMEQAEKERQKLELEYEEKFFTLKEDLLREKRMMLEMYLMSAAFQLSEAEEKKYLELANYTDCEIQHIKANFSLAGTNWINSNCPRPATSKYGAVESFEEPGTEELLAAIERKIRVPNIHFIRAARDFAEIGLIKSPGEKRLMFYRAYLCKSFTERMAYVEELLEVDPDNPDVKTLKEFTEFSLGKHNIGEHYQTIENLRLPGHAMRVIYNEMSKRQGWIGVHFRNGKMVYTFPDGEKMIDDEYDFCTRFENGYARIMKEGKWGVIDINGQTIIPCVYAALQPSIVHYQVGYWGSLDQDVYRDVHFWTVTDPLGYLAARRITGKFGIISLAGEWIVPPEEEFCPIALDKDRVIRRDDKRIWHLFDLEGNNISKASGLPSISYTPFFNIYEEGLLPCYIPVKNKETKEMELKLIFRDRSYKRVFGEEVYFDELAGSGFSEGKCKVIRNGEEFYIDKTGKRIQESDL